MASQHKTYKMDDAFKGKLDELFDAYLVKDEEMQRRYREIEELEHEFLQKFYRLRKEIIRPVMEEIRKYVMSKGLECNIEITDDGINPVNAPQSAAIMIEFGPLQLPYFSVTCDKISQVAVLDSLSLSQASSEEESEPAKKVDLKDINKEFIEETIFNLLQDFIHPKFPVA